MLNLNTLAGIFSFFHFEVIAEIASPRKLLARRELNRHCFSVQSLNTDIIISSDYEAFLSLS